MSLIIGSNINVGTYFHNLNNRKNPTAEATIEPILHDKIIPVIPKPVNKISTNILVTYATFSLIMWNEDLLPALNAPVISDDIVINIDVIIKIMIMPKSLRTNCNFGINMSIPDININEKIVDIIMPIIIHELII